MVKLLNSVNSYLLGVTQKVTAKSEATGFTSNSKDKSTALAVEPSNPLQLSLLEWINDQVIGCSESLYL
jgi:putative transposase